MKRLLVLMAALALGSVRADDTYFIWGFDQDPTVEFSMAKIHVLNGDPVFEAEKYYLTMNDVSSEDGGTEILPDDLGETTGTTIGTTYSNLGEFKGDAYSFMLELYVWDGENMNLAYESVPQQYRDLMNAGHIYENMSTSFTPYIFSVHAVPEPSGGLLLFLGTALLALRRRRV